MPLRHGVGRPLYTVLKTCAQLENPSQRLCLVPRRPHYELGDGPTERLPDPYWAHPQTLIQCDEATCHHITVISPGGEVVSHSVIQVEDDDSKVLQGTSKAKDPIPHLNRLNSQRPSGT